ncbi:MATH and LRR domain-containing protein PFE0570w-like isoform X2 [Nylanderia fulva]|uniref:MATH and LRR domain-containing protein PFE0570w-like isoform X2 n=1 Tax=Nylanderia fulva TaxID=613905 RepID=UPI0010FB1028|nr:MATH and LRR domain-containing protein PFE0570w-like isoform X2 [Nylanderia fulva]
MNNKCYAIVEFEDGLQIVPNNWLRIDEESTSFWPNFTSNKRYEKAVKHMEDPDHETWRQHPVKKIYGTFNDYAVARIQLKEAEEVSDINNSSADIKEKLKKSRKHRAAKVYYSTSNDDLDESDDTMSDIPTFSQKTCTTQEKPIKRIKVTDVQKDFNYSKTKTPNIKKSCIIKKIEHSDPHCDKSDASINSDDINNVMGTQNLSHCDKNLSDANSKKKLFIDSEDINPNVVNKYINKQVVQCDKNVSHANSEQQSYVDGEDDNNNNDINVDVIGRKTNLVINKQDMHYCDNNLCDDNYEEKNFKRFFIGKLIHFKLKMNSMERNQKLILRKLSTENFETEQKELNDINKDLPLKDENSLNVLEIKISTDVLYRNEMIKHLAYVISTDLRSSCIRLMRRIFTNELAVNYSWYGAKKKENFSKLHICQVIMSTVRRLHTNATDQEISAPIKIWLAHARERMQKRLAQMSRQESEQT